MSVSADTMIIIFSYIYTKMFVFVVTVYFDGNYI